MSKSEDYLDGLLDSINKAKSDARVSQEDTERKPKPAIEVNRRISPEEDFMVANGIASHTPRTSSRRHLRKVFSEADFLREFEEELEMDDPDSLIAEFESEIYSSKKYYDSVDEDKKAASSVLGDIGKAVSDATEQADEEFDILAGLPVEEADDSIPKEYILEASSEDEADINQSDNGEVQNDYINSEDDEPEYVDNLGIDIPMGADEYEEDNVASEDNTLDDLYEQIEEAPAKAEENKGKTLSAEDIMGAFEESDLDVGVNIMDEFAPDELDVEDVATDDPLDNLNDLLELDEDELDISSIMSGDDIGIDLSGIDLGDTSSENASGDSDEEPGKKKGKKGKKDKNAKKDKKEPNPLFIKLKRILFGEPDEDELLEAEERELSKGILDRDPESMNERERQIYDKAAAKRDAKEQKAKAKEDKAAAKEAAKKEKAEAAKAAKKAKPKKEPKPKKEKKPRKPDNSPKIPLGIIGLFMLLACSLLALVLIFTNYFGLAYHMKQAQALFDQGQYIEAFEKTNGLAITGEEDMLLRNQARMLADLQQKVNEADLLYEKEEYDLALDSYIQGIGRYEKYRDDAVNYGIADDYDKLGQLLVNYSYTRFGCTKEQALEAYNASNRHNYTVLLRRILNDYGME